MEQYIIQGGYALNGEITPSGNKNAALPLLAACLLTDEPLTLHNVPRIGDIETQIELLADLGVEAFWHDTHTITLQARTLRHTAPKASLFQRTRGSLTLMGPMLARTVRSSCPSQAVTRSAGDASIRTFSLWRLWARR